MIVDTVQNNFTNGEISPTAQGRWDLAKWGNSVKTMENFLNKQLGGALFFPGTRFIAEVKDSTERGRLLRFIYSTSQNYAIEGADLLFRFFTNGGQLTSGGSPVELVTIFPLAILPSLKYTQNADTMFIFSGTYPVQKLTRLTATSFSITQHDFKRGPFLDTNITSTTITPTSATGATTLTATSAIFAAGHVGSYWRVGDGVVKITTFISTTQVSGSVQAEPDGTAGNLGGTAATTDWAEGSFSEVRGYPSCGSFHDGRLYVARTPYQVGGLWGTKPFENDNMDVGDGDDDDAINRELDAGGEGVPAIRWLSSGPKNLQAGTTAGTITISSGNQGVAITPSNITQNRDSSFGSADIQARRLWNYVYYAQDNLKRILESGYFFDVDQNDVGDTQLMAEHILEPQAPLDSRIFRRGDDSLLGAVDMDVQQSPNNRLWVVRDDGQLAILTRNPRQEVNGWCRRVAGATISCDGKSGAGLFESIAILPQDGGPDLIYVIVNRVIDGVVQRFVEYFTEEDFKYDWDPVRLDSSLTLDNPIEITDIDTSDPIIITAPSHGFVDGDQVRFDNIVGTYQLNGRKFIVINATADTFELASEVD